MHLGNEAYTKGELSKAVEAFRSARQANTNDYESTWKLARALNDQAISLKTGSSEQKKAFLEAYSLALEATRLDPKDSKGFLYLAITEGKVALIEGGKKKVELGKDVKAQAEKAVELNPKEDLAYHVLGIWNREMATLNFFLKTFAELIYGKFPSASLNDSVTAFKKAIELNPKSVAHHVELGLTYAEMKKWSEAKSELETAINLPKQYPADEGYQQQGRDALKQVSKHVKAG